jgi:hypothetical protein
VKRRFLGQGRFARNQQHSRNLASWTFEFVEHGETETLGCSSELLYTTGEKLRLSGAIDRMDVDHAALDPSGSGLWCSTAWDRDEAELLCINGYYIAYLQFVSVYAAVEALKHSTEIGRELRKNRLREAPQRFEALNFYYRMVPAIRDAFFGIGLPGSRASRTNAVASLCPERDSLQATHFHLGNDLVRKYRHYLVHGEERAPDPDDDWNRFRLGHDHFLVPPQICRLLRMSSLALILIHVFMLNSLKLPDTYEPRFQFLDGKLLRPDWYCPRTMLARCCPSASRDGSTQGHLSLI